MKNKLLSYQLQTPHSFSLKSNISRNVITHFISTDVLHNCPSLGNFHSSFLVLISERCDKSEVLSQWKWRDFCHRHTVAAWLSAGVMKKGTGCRKNSGSPEVMSGRRAAPIRQVVWRHVMDRKPPVLSVGWQMLMKHRDKRLGEAARRDLWHSVEAACHSKHINNVYSAGVERVAATSWLDLHRREDSSDLGILFTEGSLRKRKLWSLSLATGFQSKAAFNCNARWQFIPDENDIFLYFPHAKQKFSFQVYFQKGNLFECKN